MSWILCETSFTILLPVCPIPIPCLHSIPVPIPALPAPHLLGGEESGEEEEEGGGGATDGVSSGTVELEFNLKSYLER